MTAPTFVCTLSPSPPTRSPLPSILPGLLSLSTGGVVLAVAAALLTLAFPVSAGDCPTLPDPCVGESWPPVGYPDTGGLVLADARYDFGDPGDIDSDGVVCEADGVLDRRELQCAIDSLDGDDAPEFLLGSILPPERIRGGKLTLVPSLRYLVNGPLRLPFWADGQVIVDGNGATIWLDPASPPGPSAILERKAPWIARDGDLTIMARYGERWIVENLKFQVDSSAPPPPRWAAIEVHGVSQFVVRKCHFVGLPIGVSFQRTVNSRIEDCIFEGQTLHDLILADGTHCFADPSQRCWPGGTGSALAWPGSVAGSAIDIASIGAKITNTYHRAAGGGASILVSESDNVVIDQPLFEGLRSEPVISRESKQLWQWNPPVYQQERMVLRDATFDVGTLGALETPLIDNRGSGLVVLDGIQVLLDPLRGDDWLYDVYYAPFSTWTVLSNIHPFPRSLKLRGVTDRHPWPHYFSVVDVAETDPIPAPERWLDEFRQPGAVPEYLSILSFETWKLPRKVPNPNPLSSSLPEAEQGEMYYDPIPTLQGLPGSHRELKARDNRAGRSVWTVGLE